MKRHFQESAEQDPDPADPSAAARTHSLLHSPSFSLGSASLLRFLSLGLLILTFAAPPVSAEGLFGAVFGKVSAAHDLAVAPTALGDTQLDRGIQIFIESDQLERPLRTEVDADGRFFVSSLQPGIYSVRAVGSKHASRPMPVKLIQGQIASLSLEMHDLEAQDFRDTAEAESNSSSNLEIPSGGVAITMAVYDEETGSWNVPGDQAAIEGVVASFLRPTVAKNTAKGDS